MKVTTTLIAASVAALFSAAAAAQSLESLEQRDLQQQQRIYQGLESGQLTAREAARLEAESNRIDRLQAGALRDGRLSEAERNRIDSAQDRLGRNIYSQSHDNQMANPNSRSSQRMQNIVQGEIREDRRIAQGVASGRLDPREAARAEYRNLEGRGGYGQYGDRRFGYSDNRWNDRFDRNDRFGRNDNNGRHYGWTNGQHNGWDRAGFEGRPGWGGRRDHDSTPSTSGSPSGTSAGSASNTTGRHGGWDRTASTDRRGSGDRGSWSRNTGTTSTGSGTTAGTSTGTTTGSASTGTTQRGSWSRGSGTSTSTSVSTGTSTRGSWGQRSGSTSGAVAMNGGQRSGSRQR